MAAAARVTPPHRQGAGFTLVELIVALAMFATIGGAVGVTLRNGIRSWEQIHRVSDREQRLRFALRLLERDAAQAILLNGANDQQQPPVFTATSLSFVTVDSPSSPETQMPRLQRVLVRAEAQPDGTQSLVRRAAPYPSSPESSFGRAQVLLTQLQDCRFAYLYRNPTTQQFLWQPTWDPLATPPGALPRGVRLELVGAADQPLAVSHVYEIPVGLLGFTEVTP